MSITQNIDESIMKLGDILAENKPILVAFSGGVDSSFLAYCASRFLGENMAAVTVHTPFSIQQELNHAYAFAEKYGFRHNVLDVDILNKEEVVKNDAMRCYFCKKCIFSEIRNFAEKNGYSRIAEGSTQSDSGDYRPGKKALKELKIISPLERAGFTRELILEGYSREGITLDDHSAHSCLATRVAYGDIITREALKKIETAEGALYSMGLGPLRVRSHGYVARIELCPEKVKLAVIDESLRRNIIQAVKKAGFPYVTIDIEGLRSGSMNEILNM